MTIFRPSVVCGDSKTGETAKYDGIYYVIKFLLKFPEVFRLVNVGNEDVRLNLVPVDFVVDAMVALARTSVPSGKRSHLPIQSADDKRNLRLDRTCRDKQEIDRHAARKCRRNISEFAIFAADYGSAALGCSVLFCSADIRHNCFDRIAQRSRDQVPGI